MLKPIKRSNEDIEALEKEVEELQEKRNQKNSPDFDKDVAEAEEAQKDEALSPDERNWAKRFADTKSWASKKVNEATKKVAELEEQITQLQGQIPSNMPSTKEELDKWKEEYPEVAKAIEAIATEKANDLSKELGSEIETLKGKNKETEVALVKKKIKEVHPEFDEYAADPEFHEWVETKSKWVSEALYEGTDAGLAIDALNLYKVDNGIPLKGEEPEGKKKRGRPRKEEAEAAKLATGNTADSPKDSTNSEYLLESEVLKWTDEEFAEKFDLYQKAKSTGKLILDVSGKKAS